MKYPCGIIKDLLPLYIDDVCNEESRQAVENHLADCEACRKCQEVMKAADGVAERKINNPEDMKMANSLKNVKSRINRRIAGIVLCAVVIILVCVGGYHLLFNIPIKDVPLTDVSISANVYSVEELIESRGEQVHDSDTVVISANENDDSGLVAVRIPEIGGETITVTENIVEEYQFLSVVSVQSDYFLRSIKKDRIDDTIYITAIKTTLLNNKAAVYQKNICGLEFGEINKVVFVDENGTETVLWSR